MFRYKICYHCKDHYIILFVAIVYMVICIYVVLAKNIVYNLYDWFHIILLFIPSIMCIILNVMHYKEHQKKEFNKILKKFGVK